MIHIALAGANGRMGNEIAALARQRSDLEITAFIDKFFKSEGNRYNSAAGVSIPTDVLLDFSHTSALKENLDYAKSRNIPIVSGVTGMSEDERKLLEERAKHQTIFYAPNFSIGIFALRKTAVMLSKLLEGWDIEIVETHHNQKADAPSGTANLLLSDLENATGFNRISNRDGKRKNTEIGIHAVRGGTVSGIHDVQFLGAYETVSVKHVAESRQVFAQGALFACKFVCENKLPAGRIYTMDDCLKV